MLDEFREFLEGKIADGVKSIRLGTVLQQFEQAVASERSASTKRGRIRPDDLLGAYEVAELLGVDRTRPSKWMAKGTRFGPDNVPFPEPFRYGRNAEHPEGLAAGPIWLRSDVEKMIPFVESRRRVRAA